MTAEEKEFEKYLQDARAEFVYEVGKYTVENNLALRTVSDSFLIAFDQLNKAYHQAKLKELEEKDFVCGIVRQRCDVQCSECKNV